MGFFSNMFGSKNYTNINNEELQNIIKNNKNALILDVRTIGEFRSGHIPNAKNIPVQELNSHINNLDAYKNADIIVYSDKEVKRVEKQLKEVENLTTDEYLRQALKLMMKK